MGVPEVAGAGLATAVTGFHAHCGGYTPVLQKSLLKFVAGEYVSASATRVVVVVVAVVELVEAATLVEVAVVVEVVEVVVPVAEPEAPPPHDTVTIAITMAMTNLPGSKADLAIACNVISFTARPLAILLFFLQSNIVSEHWQQPVSHEYGIPRLPEGIAV